MLRGLRRTIQAVRLLAVKPNEVVLTSTPEQQERYARILGGSADVYPLDIAPVTVVKTDQRTLSDLVNAWSGRTKSATLARDLNLDDLLSIELSHPKQGSARAKDEDPWNLELVGQPAASEYTKGDGATVAVLDTGVDYTHTEISPRFGREKGIDIVGDRDPMDRHGHGTHVAGTVAGRTVGMAPAAKLYAVKVLDDYGSGRDGGVIRGIDWAAKKEVDVINMSLGGPGRSMAFQMVIDAAHEKGVTIVAAAGNDGAHRASYPAAYNHVISVAAVDRNKERAGFSNMHETLDLAAPGVDVRSLTPGGGYRLLSGTSMASPHIAGAAALLRSYDVADPEGAMKRTAEERGDRLEYGAGLARVDRALESEENVYAKAASVTKNFIRRYVI